MHVMEYSSALSFIKSRESVIFFGSYFSKGAKNYSLADAEIPSVDVLKEKLLAKVDMKDSYDNSLKDITDYMEGTIGSPALVEFLTNEFTVKTFTKDQEAIADQPWRSIFTTNYDDLVEKITGKIASSPNNNLHLEMSIDKLVNHVNGYKDDIASKTGLVNIRLDNTSYVNNQFISSTMSDIFCQELSSAKAIFFVGFSLSSDLDIERLITANADKNKVFFINGDSSDAIQAARLNKIGTFTGKGVKDFAKDLGDLKENPFAGIATSQRYTSLEQVVESENMADEPSGEVLHNLLTKGILDESRVLNQKYIVDRWSSESEKILDSPQTQIFCVESALGNGKTIFMNGMEQYLCNRRNVFRYSGAPDKLYDDLMKLSRLHSKAIVFIDTVSQLDNSLGPISICAEKGIQFVVSDRTNIMNRIVKTLIDSFSINANKVVYLSNLNVLSHKDFTHWTNIVSSHHLWGNKNVSDIYKIYRGKSPKYHHAITSFSNLLIEIFNSTGIYSKYTDSIAKIQENNPETLQLIIAVLIFNYLGRSDNYPLFKLIHLLRINVTESLKSDPTLSLFVDLEKLTYNSNSSILAHKLLNDRKVFKREDIVKTLLCLMKSLDTQPHSLQSMSLLRAFTSFPNLADILGKGRRDKSIHSILLDYYDKIQELSFSNKNVHIFVQLANCNTYSGNMELAERYLAFANKVAVDTKLLYTGHIITAQINVYIEFAANIMQNSPEDFLTDLRWISSHCFDVDDTAYVCSEMGKLLSDKNHFLAKIKLQDREYQLQVLELLTDIHESLFQALRYMRNSKHPDEHLRKFDLTINKIRNYTLHS